MTEASDLPKRIEEPWRVFLQTFEPLRPELHRWLRQREARRR